MEISEGQGQGASLFCFPLLNSSCSKKRMRSTPLYVLFSLVLFSVSLLTVFLNMLVIISISHYKQLHTPTNLLLLSLSLADLLMGLLVMPVESLRILQSCWYLGRLLCAASPYTLYVLISASLSHMVLLSVDRYLAVCDPLLYQAKVTLGRTVAATTLSWVFSLLYNVFIMLDHLMEPDAFGSCHGECVVVINYTSGMIDLVVTFIAPCTVIVVLYMRVFVVAISQARGIQSKVVGVKSGMATVVVKKSERKAARTLGIIIFMFLLCFSPYFCFSFAGNTSSSSVALLYLSWVMQINSCLNPLIYALFYPWFKKATKHILSLKILQTSSSLFNVLNS